MKRQIFLVTTLLAAQPVLAHDFWLQPSTFRLASGDQTEFSIQVGHGSLRQPAGIAPERVLTLKTIGPAGSVDERKSLLGKIQNFSIKFPKPGTYIVEMETNHASSDLPAIRYNDYAKFEGLTPALALREKAGKTQDPGREIYSRRCKALIQVGDPGSENARYVTKPLGMTLEIVPDKNPYTLKPGELLPVHVYYEGRPLPGALVMLTNLEFDAKELATHKTDEQGRASFEVPRTGTWLLNVVWTKPITGNPDAEFDTTFASLTFSFWHAPLKL